MKKLLLLLLAFSALFLSTQYSSCRWREFWIPAAVPVFVLQLGQRPELLRRARRLLKEGSEYGT
jgi:hypothetical protein